MSWTKRQFVEHAFEEIGYAVYAYDLEPEQLQGALRRLDAMMATWNGKSISLGYPLPDSPETSDLDEITNVPDRANEAIFLNLAIRIAPSVGKEASMGTKSAAKSALTEVLSWAVKPLEMNLPGTMPSGAGNKPWRNNDPFVQPIDDGMINAPEDTLEFKP